MYSWWLFIKGQHTVETAYIVHAYLMNILQDVFLDDEIRFVSNCLFNHIDQNPNTNVELEKLNELFPDELKIKFKDKIIELINRET